MWTSASSPTPPFFYVLSFTERKSDTLACWMKLNNADLLLYLKAHSDDGARYQISCNCFSLFFILKFVVNAKKNSKWLDEQILILKNIFKVRSRQTIGKFTLVFKRDYRNSCLFWNSFEAIIILFTRSPN